MPASAAFVLSLGLLPAAAAPGFDPLLSVRSLTREDEIALSRDGRYAAFPVDTPQDGPKDERHYLPNGTPMGLPGTRLRLADARGGAMPDPCPARGSCWRAAWSPDGKSLAFYSDADGTPQPWIFDRESGASRRLSEARVQPHHWMGDAPLWSPDGKALFLHLRPELSDSSPSAVPGDAMAPRVLRSPSPGGQSEASDRDAARRENLSTIARLDIASGALSVAVPSDAAPGPAAARLSPSGRWVSYFSVFRRSSPADRQSVHDLAVVPAGGGRPRVLARGLLVPEIDYFLNNYRWHPSEDRLVYLADGALWEVDLRGGGGKPRRVRGAPSGLLESPLLFSRDGREVLVAAGTPDPATFGPQLPAKYLWVPLDGAPARALDVPAAWNRASVLGADEKTAWQPEPGSLTVYARSKEGGRLVARFSRDGGPPRELWRGVGTFSRFANPAHEGGILAHFEDPSTPPALFWLDADLGSRRRLAAVDPELDRFVGPRSRGLSCRAPTFGGETVEARFSVVLPERGRPPFPAVAVVYPDLDYSILGERFPAAWRVGQVPLAALTGSGYAVLLSHMRIGPLGKAGEPAREIAEHLLPQVEEAARQGLIDGARVAVLGHSYGGYAVGAIVSHTDRFKAAVAVSGMYDLGALYGTRDKDGRTPFVSRSEGGQHRMGGPPWADPERYTRNSAFYRADKIRTPLLLIHGEEDVAFSDAQRLFSALERLGRPATLVQYPKEGHSPNRWSRSHDRDALARVLAFLDGHLGGRAR